VEELPLARVGNQPYIHYNKGSLVMVLLADRLGEERVNGLLAQLLREWRFKGPPYPRSLVLVDGLGEETRARLADEIEIGLFAELPDQAAFGREDVLVLERRPVRDGVQTIRAVSAKKPAFAGIDPYNKYVDRNSDDNVIAVD
jgi:hypothetical protein